MIDACVLFPTVMREVVLGVAQEGLFEAKWSDRILEEWARATAKLGPGAETIARGEGVLLGVRFPRAIVSVDPGVMARFWLPDPNDVHVLAAAVVGSCDAIMTLNARDFPKDVLADEGVARVDPDGFLTGLFGQNPDAVRRAADRVLAEANRLSDQSWDMRRLLKKAHLNRLGKALS